MPSRPSLSRRASALMLAALSSAFVAGCAEKPHFDAAQYRLITTSVVLRDNASAGFLAQSENFLFRDPYLDWGAYVPHFCSPTSTITVAGDASSVALDFQGCLYGGDRMNGELRYTSEGKYEGLLHVTLTLNGTGTTFDAWFTIAPTDLPME